MYVVILVYMSYLFFLLSDMERQAARLAAEIENQGDSGYRAQLENGDEEDAFRYPTPGIRG